MFIQPNPLGFLLCNPFSFHFFLCHSSAAQLKSFKRGQVRGGGGVCGGVGGGTDYC